MNRKQLFLLLGALTLGWAANAQSTGNIPNSDTTQITHRRFHRNGHPDSSFAFHRPNQNPFQHDRRGHDGFGRHGFGHRNMIHYTPEQRQQVAVINKDFRQKQQDLFKQDNITLKQYKSNLLSLEKDRKAKLQALLTQQQKDQIATRRKRMDDNHQVKAAARLERLRLNLNLTDDQVAKIKAGQSNLHDQAKAIHDNESLLPQEKREQMHALMMTRIDNLKTILTPDQYTKFQQMFHHRHGGPWQGRGGYSGKTV